MLKQMAQSVCKMLKEIKQETKKAVVELHKDYSNAQQIKLNQIQLNNSIENLNQIRWELSCVVCDRKYPYLEEVQVVEDIVPIRLQPPQVGILLENPSQQRPSFALPQVRDKMNYDIGCFREKIMLNQEQACYPCIMAGMYIADIRANGIYAVLTTGFPKGHPLAHDFA